MNKKWYILAPILAFFLATAVYLLFMEGFHAYGPEGARFEAMLSQYSHIEPDSILFVGDSQIQDGIDCTYIDSVDNICYNLGLSGLIPIQLALQKDLLVNTKPKLVVIGTSAAFFDESINRNDDLYALMATHKNIKLDDFLSKRLTENEKELLALTFYEQALYKRKFILPFIFGVFKSILTTQPFVPNVIHNYKNPHFFIHQESEDILLAKLDHPEIVAIFQIKNTPRRQRDAFHYVIKELQEEGIKVVILHMPFHQLVFENIPASSHEAFNQYLMALSKKLDVPLVVVQHEFERDEFTDLTHLNTKGSAKLSQGIVEGTYNVIQ